MERTIVMSHRELHRAHVLERVLQDALSLKEARELLQVSYRQVKRLKKRYSQYGTEGLAHGNRGRPVAHALTKDRIGQVLGLYVRKYRKFNDTHFTEMLEEQERITLSRETVRRILRRAGKRPKRRRRAPRHHARRPRKTQRGTMIQWDGSPHCWFGVDRPPCCLMAAIDDADSKLLAALFVPAESAVAYIQFLDKVLQRHGIPLSVYHDRHSALERTDTHWSLEEQFLGRQFPTHVGRVLEDLSIRAIPAYSPQAKGRVERCFGVLQDRLIAELHLEGITDITTANRWLDKTFIHRHSQRFTIKPLEATSAFRKASKQERYQKIAFAYEATVANDNCVRLGGLIIDIPPGKRRRSYAKAKVLVKQHLDGAWTIWYKDEKIAAHQPTAFKEPIRSWKRRSPGQTTGTRSMIQVYLNSKPAPPTKGTLSHCS